MFRILLIATIVLPASCKAQALPDCPLSIYAVNANGTTSDRPLLSASHVVTVKDGGVDVSGLHSWLVKLTPEGTEINAVHTKAHIGDKLAIFCGSKEIARPTIAGPSTDEFTFLVQAGEP